MYMPCWSRCALPVSWMSERQTIEQQLQEGQLVSVATKGVSMQPLLYTGQSHVILAPVKGPLRWGDLPLFRTPDGTYIIHRIIRTDGACYYTRGDNCYTKERVPREWVLGVVVEIYRKGRCISVHHPLYRLYARVWPMLFPVRYVLMRMKGRLHRLSGKGEPS